MGLLSQHAGSAAPAMAASDEVLLLHAVLLMMEADGVIEESEHEALRSFLYTLPEFADKDNDQISTMMDQRKKLLSNVQTFQEAIQLLSGIQREEVKLKAFALAVDVAMASGDVAENEDQVLEGMQRILEVSDENTQKIIEVFAIKYAR